MTGNIRRRDLLAAAGAAGVASAFSAPLKAFAFAGVPDDEERRTVVRAILCNQLGYLPGHEKIATVLLHRDAEEKTTVLAGSAAWVFEVRAREADAVVFSGPLGMPRLDAASGDLVCDADFSALKVAGAYRVEALAVRGDVFAIEEKAYAEGLRLAMRFYYGQRCGTKVDLGDGYKHGACHQHGEYDVTSGRHGRVPNHGGWHDAGDYGRYVVNSGITCGTLLWAWELYPEALRGLTLGIPESGGRLPDYLAEVRWNLRWMLQMQDETDGGVWHKQTSAAFCAFIRPEKDKLPSKIIGTGFEPCKSTCASADFAAVMAIAARCYRPFDAGFAEHCLAAARRAFAWAAAHPDVIFRNPKTVTTGEYGDAHCADEVLWAAAELFRTTGEALYDGAVKASIAASFPKLEVEAPSWGGVLSMGLWTYAFAGRSAGSELVTQIEEATQVAAGRLINQRAKNGYGNTLSLHDYHWGSNSNAGNQSMLLLVAHRFRAQPKALDAALANLHYLLGRNCFGVSWVTQLGRRPFRNPHHRPSAADGIAAPWPGLLSGGPNAYGGDEVADHLPEAAPMRMWVDDERAYSMNEVAINWNAPLVFLLAAANTFKSEGIR